MVDALPSPLARAVERYLSYLQSEENKAPLTVESYRQSLTAISTLLDVADPLLIDKAAVRRLKQRLHAYRTERGRELSVRTKNHHLTVLRSFLRYLLTVLTAFQSGGGGRVNLVALGG